MSQTDKTRVRLALIVALACVIVPAIASAQPDLGARTSTSSRAPAAGARSALPRGVYRTRSFWDGGEGERQAYIDSLESRARTRSTKSPERSPLRPQLVTASAGAAASGASGAIAGQPDWYATAACESGGRWDLNTGNGYWGGLQFAPSTWFAYGGGPFDGTGPFPYSAGEQIAVAQAVLAAQGPGAWPSCFAWQ